MVWRLIIHTVAVLVLSIVIGTIISIPVVFVGSALGFFSPEQIAALQDNPAVLEANLILLVTQGVVLLIAVPLATWLVGHFVGRRKVFED
ncbi:MAG: hypothetical protein ACFB51_06715, partial [Anaerolineae bacterium]